MESGVRSFYGNFNQVSAFTVYVDNLPNRVAIPWFSKFFSNFGRVVDAFLPLKRSNKTGNRIGFVRYENQRDVAKAIAKANGLWVGRKNLFVKRANYDLGARYGEFSTRVHNSQSIHGASAGPSGGGVKISHNPTSNFINQYNLKSGKVFPELQVPKEIAKRVTLNFQPIATDWLQTSAVAKTITLSSPELVQKAFNEINMAVQVRSLGGMFLIITFSNMEVRSQALDNLMIKSWFSSFKPWNGEAASLSRLVWVKCRGMPLNVWCLNTFKRIGEIWGEFIALDEDTVHGRSFEVGKMMIVTESPDNINDWINVCVRGKNYRVKVWEEECEVLANDQDAKRIVSQQCSVNVFRPVTKRKIVDGNDDAEVEMAMDAMSKNDLDVQSAVNGECEVATPLLRDGEHKIVQPPCHVGATLDQMVDVGEAKESLEAHENADINAMDLEEGKSSAVSEEKDFIEENKEVENSLEDLDINRYDISDEGPILDPFEGNHVPIQAAVKGMKGKKRRKNIDEILGFSKMKLGNQKGGRNKNKCVILRSAVAAAALSASISSEGINNRNRILLDEAQAIWEVNKIFGLGYDGDENEVINKIAEMEAQNKERTCQL